MNVSKFEEIVLKFIDELKEVESLGLSDEQTANKMNEVGMKYGIRSASKIVS